MALINHMDSCITTGTFTKEIEQRFVSVWIYDCITKNTIAYLIYILRVIEVYFLDTVTELIQFFDHIEDFDQSESSILLMRSCGSQANE